MYLRWEIRNLSEKLQSNDEKRAVETFTSASVRLVGARIGRAEATGNHLHSTPFRITRRFLRSKRKVFSHWVCLGRMLNHFSATSGVVSSR